MDEAVVDIRRVRRDLRRDRYLGDSKALFDSFFLLQSCDTIVKHSSECAADKSGLPIFVIKVLTNG